MVVKRLNWEQKESIKDFLLQHSKKVNVGYNQLMVAGKGSVEAASTKFGVTTKSIYKIWGDMRELDKSGQAMVVKPKFAGNKIAPMVMNSSQIGLIELKRRKTIRALAVSIEKSKSTVGKWKKKGDLRSATSAVKPLLNEHHMFSRLKFCLKAITVDHTGQTRFKSMDNIVHIDEKWFYLKQLVERFILLPHEITPHRSTNSKGFIPKLMFMCAVSRPIFGPGGEVVWDGRLGIWPFVEEVAAKRGSVYRPRGTLELKPIPSVDKDCIRDMVINHIIPAIKANWPEGLSKDIKIQQDNAPCHVSANDPEFLAAATSDVFNITMVNQPARSPDTNVNDLGFFNSIQSLQQEMQTENLEELIEAVQMAFEVLKPETLDDVFLTSQQCMVEMLKVKGHIKYNLPHMGKQHLRSIGMLPRDLTVDIGLVRECIEYLLENNQQIDNAFLLETLGYYV